MLESSPACPSPNYSHVIYSTGRYYLTSTSIKLYHWDSFRIKAELAKIKIEVKELKNQLIVINLSLINKVRHSGKSTPSISRPFQHKCLLQHSKNKNPFPLQDTKIKKEVGENFGEKSAKKIGKKMEYKQYILEELQKLFDKE